MADGIEIGLTTTKKLEIDRDRCIDHMGDALAVYATPRMLGDAELTCHELILPLLGDDQSTVGTHVEMQHMAPSLEGDTVAITATVTNVGRRAISFDVSIRDSIEEVGRVKHNRFIVDNARTLERLTAKRAQLNAGG